VNEEALTHWEKNKQNQVHAGEFASFKMCFRRRSLPVVVVNRMQLPSSFNPSFILHPFVLRLSALTLVANLHQFLLCAFSFSV
jgi:hypothetical protein